MNKPSTRNPSSHILVDNVKVSYEKNIKPLTEHLSQEDCTRFARLLEQAQENPKGIYKEALAWQEKNRFPEMDNLICFLHLKNRNVKKAEKLIEEAFHRYPHYLFAKINYADQCLRKGSWSQIPTIFSSFSLQELFPQKHAFHVAEFRGFMTLMGHYHLKIGQRAKAESYYQKAFLVDPLHPSVICLERTLFHKSLLKKWLERLLNLAPIRRIL